MYSVLSVHFDNNIPNWKTYNETTYMNILVLVVEGKVCYMINNKKVIAERGDLLYIPKSTKRLGRNDESGPHQKYTILFHFQEEAEQIPYLKHNHFFKYKIHNFQYLLNRFARLYEEQRGEDAYSSHISEGIFQELLGRIAREMEKPEISPMKMKYAEMISRYIMEHYREPIEINHLANLINRSKNYTSSIFKEVTGQTPIKYMHQLRVKEACNLLINTSMTVAEISDYLGYYDPSYFFRIFKKFVSMSPSDFVAYGNPKVF